MTVAGKQKAWETCLVVTAAGAVVCSGVAMATGDPWFYAAIAFFAGLGVVDYLLESRAQRRRRAVRRRAE